MIEIHSAVCSASINEIGAELSSLTLTSTQQEFMWSGDPAIWSGIAPILFPIIGALKDDRYFAKDQWYPMLKHGFARECQFEVTKQSNESVTFKLVSNEQTLKQYPWAFELIVDFTLEERQLTIGYTVVNQDQEPMLFNIGSHPAFSLPIENDDVAESISKHQIRFNQGESLKQFLLTDGVLETSPQTYKLDESVIPLNPLIFDHDALIFCDITSDVVSLEHVDKGPRIEVSTGGAPHIGIWAKPAAPYVCIEPWWGHADFADASGNLEEKAAIQKLEAGASFTTDITINVVG